ncbi:MAG: M20/M25/M40 family metallo-hydrolase [Sphingomonas sp.]|nr:M20/M25/M40 family metallo-hydrolase [Sphingomonas sp.]
MRSFAFLPLIAIAAVPVAATPPGPGPEDVVAERARQVDSAQLRASIEKLVSFGTRHTLSSQTHPTRGIGAALNWTDSQFKSFGLPTVRPCETFTGARIPTPTPVCNAVAIQRGTTRPNDVVIITGHIDSRVSDVMDATSDAPGANDDGSGTAAVIEAARVLSKHKFPGTIVYAALSGEEQGLYGGKVMANYAKAQGWNVVANLNNDIIGNSCGSDGMCNARQVRVFSEGPRWQGREELADDIRRFGGENDSPSRNLSRFLDRLAERVGPPVNLDVAQIWRNDRFGRGGDHTEFLNAGYPAVRFSVAVEDYDHQHQDLRTEKGTKFGDTVDEMDFAYLTAVTQLNVAALAWLANAPPTPGNPVAEGAVANDTTIRFKPVSGAQRYLVRWRATDANQWPFQEQVMPVLPQSGACARPDGLCEVVVKGVRVDNWVFGVSSVSERGYESPVAAALPGGAFQPYVEPPAKP